LLPETLPEREGWVDREKLHDLSGRTRKPQMAMAGQMGFEDYAQPAGGCCFLTDEQYSKKFVDLWEARGDRDYELDDIMLLKVGRHIRPAKHYKLIVGREEGENNFLSGYRKQFASIKTVSHAGPLVLVDGKPTDDDLEFAARIAARYSQGRMADKVTVEITNTQGVSRQIDVEPLEPNQIPEDWHV
jgi:tRNA U34 2-thiouridine synthase MnmA/TrmU